MAPPDESVSVATCDARHELLTQAQDRMYKAQEKHTGKMEAIDGKVSDISNHLARLNGKENGLREAETSQVNIKSLRRRRLELYTKWVGYVIAIIGAVFAMGKIAGNTMASNMEVVVKQVVEETVNGNGRGGP